MKTKLTVSAAVVALACLPSCTSPTLDDPNTGDDGVEADENLGTSSQAICVGGPGPRPTPVVYVPGFLNPISSGTYNYGSGACDGYPVQFTQLTNTTGYRIEVRVGDSPSQSVCEYTSMTAWVWHRYNGGSWVYAGSASNDAFWHEPQQKCLNVMTFRKDAPLGAYEVIVKAQARSERNTGGSGYAYNRPVTVKAIQGWREPAN